MEAASQDSPQKPLVVGYDLYDGKSPDDARHLLQSLDYGQFSRWDKSTDKPEFVFMHYCFDSNKSEILGHLAKSNPVLAALREDPWATFWVNGPSAYIPSHWTGPDRAVPTSYYSWAQFDVRVAIVDDREEKRALLSAMLARFQPEGLHPPMDPSEKFWQGMLDAITGVRMVIQSSRSRHKYGQNRPRDVRRRITEHLRARNEAQDEQVAGQVLARLDEGAGKS